MGSANTLSSWVAMSWRISMVAGKVARSILRASLITELIRTTFCSFLSGRLKARIWLTRSLARWPALRTWFNFRSKLAISRNSRQCHLGVAQHHPQDVVEVMGNPSGQGSHGFHLLALKKPCPQDLLLTHIDDKVKHRWLPLIIDAGGPEGNVKSCPVFFQSHALVIRLDRLSRQDIAMPTLDPFPVFRGIKHIHRLTHNLISVVITKGLDQGGIGIDLEVQGVDSDADGRFIDQEPGFLPLRL